MHILSCWTRQFFPNATLQLAFNESCASCGYQKCHLFLEAVSHVGVWPLYLHAQKVSATLDTTTQKRLESLAVRWSTNYCFVVILHDSCMWSGEVFGWKDFLFEMWWHFGIILVLTVATGSPQSYPKVQGLLWCPVLALESSPSRGSGTFVVTLSPSGKMKTIRLPTSRLCWLMFTWKRNSVFGKDITDNIVWALSCKSQFI